MISILVRYFIYEKCIDLIYDRMKANFTQLDPTLLKHFISKHIKVHGRKLSAKFTLELQQDLVAFHGLDIQEEMLTQLQAEIQNEIDNEILTNMSEFAARESSIIYAPYPC